METQITKKQTNYSIVLEQENGLKLDGNFSINENNLIENYNISIFDNENILIGNSVYNENTDAENYNYSVQDKLSKSDIISLVDESILVIKEQLIPE